MSQSKAHAYSQALISAWEKFATETTFEDGPVAEDFPGLVESLFVVTCGADDQFAFRNVGPGVERLFGRELVEHDFLSLWEGSDRSLVLAAARSAIVDNGPVVLSACAAVLEGKAVELEFTLAPIRNASGDVSRLLGLCQTLSLAAEANGRPIGRMRLVAVFPPATPRTKPQLRLVVCNA